MGCLLCADSAGIVVPPTRGTLQWEVVTGALVYSQLRRERPPFRGSGWKKHVTERDHTMSTLMMCRLVVAGPKQDVEDFMQRAVASGLELAENGKGRFWKVRRVLSFARLEAMQASPSDGDYDLLDSGRVWLDAVHETTTGFKRATYKIDVYDSDPTDVFVRVSALWRRLAFLFVTAEPNSDWYGCDFITGGRLRSYRVPDRTRSQIRRAKYRYYRVPYPDGGGDDSLEDVADFEADWAIMDASEAHWEPRLRKWLTRARKQANR